jgi:hypothetical protein
VPSGASSVKWAVRSALPAIQAGSWMCLCWQQPRECVEMTPPGRRRSPLLTLAGKWSSSSGTINGDRSPCGAGGWRGGGVARLARVGGISGRGQKTHRPARRHRKGSQGHRISPGDITMGHHTTKEADSHRITPHSL